MRTSIVFFTTPIDLSFFDAADNHVFRVPIDFAGTLDQVQVFPSDMPDDVSSLAPGEIVHFAGLLQAGRVCLDKVKASKLREKAV